MSKKGTLIFLAVALVLLAGNVVAIPYTFMNISDNANGKFSQFNPDFTGPSLNNNGTVAFAARLVGTGERGVFTGSGGSVTTIADGTIGPFSAVGGYVSLNNNGTVALTATLRTGQQGIFTSRGGAITTIVDTPPIGPFSIASFPSLNDSGTVAFYAEVGTSQRAIFTGNGGPITTIADTTVGPFSFLRLPSINNSGTVAFGASSDSGSGIFISNGGPVTTVAFDRGFNPTKFLGFGTPSLNDNGTVAFAASLVGTGEAGVFLGSGGPVTTIFDGTARPFKFVDRPSLNESGAVAFFAELDTGGEGIFTGGDPLMDKVIQTGDSLFGSTVTGGSFIGAPSLNDLGQIAFYYRLLDGREGIARADPLANSIPEPATLALLVTGLIAAGLRCKVQWI